MHFLNYVLAMEERAANERVRHAIIRLGLGTAMQANDLEQWIFDALAREIGIGDTGVALWRRLHGGEALALALEQARRLGFAAISVAVDFGAVDASSCHDYLLELARAAARNRQIIFNMYVAAHTTSPADAVGLQVGAQGEAETMLAALARARRVLNPQAAATLYDGADLGAFEAQAIFPFDPLCLPILRSLAGSSNRIAGIAKLVLSVIAPWREAADGFRPLLPIDLLQSAMLGRLIDDRLGGNGRAARRIAHAAAHSMEESARAREIVDSLILEHLSGARALSASQLRTRLPERHHRNGQFRLGIDGLLEALDAQSGGVIVYRSQQAWFNPAAAGAPEIAAYNLALPLLRRFDSRLSEAAQPADLRTSLKRASEAMARSVEAAHRAAAVLEAALHEMHSDLKPEHRLVLDHFGCACGGRAATVDRRRCVTGIASAYRARDPGIRGDKDRGGGRAAGPLDA